MSELFSSVTPRVDIYTAAAAPSPQQKDVPPLPDRAERFDPKRAAKERDAHAQRDIRRVRIGVLTGLVTGVAVDVVLASFVVPAWFGSLWVQVGLVATFVLAGVLIALIPSLRFHSGKSR